MKYWLRDARRLWRRIDRSRCVVHDLHVVNRGVAVCHRCGQRLTWGLRAAVLFWLGPHHANRRAR